MHSEDHQTGFDLQNVLVAEKKNIPVVSIEAIVLRSDFVLFFLRVQSSFVIRIIPALAQK